jgi:predicted dehydrogenase
MMIGVAVVGAGHWGPHLVRNFNDHLSSQTLWVVDQAEMRRKAIGERFPSVSLSADIEDALGDDRVDAVVIATPTSTHSGLVQRALEAKKHVLVEKPITNSLADAAELCRLAEKHQRVLMVGHVFLFNPAVRAAKDYIDAGDLGEIEYLSMTRTNLGPVRTDVNAAWDLASHDISIANYWLGTVPDTVSASGGSWINQGMQDVVFATLRYPKGVVVHIEASWLNPRKRRLISVIGAERMLTVDDMDLNEPLRLYDKGVVGAESEITDTFAGFRSQIREGQVLIPHVTTGEPLRAECDSFLARIRGGDDSLSDGWAGADVVAVLEAIDGSMAKDGAQQEVERVR